jgi:hypothetical protein
MHLDIQMKDSIFSLFFLLPRIQKIAEPASRIINNGIDRQSTAKYCCVNGIGRPEKKIQT